MSKPPTRPSTTGSSLSRTSSVAAPSSSRSSVIGANNMATTNNDPEFPARYHQQQHHRRSSTATTSSSVNNGDTDNDNNRPSRARRTSRKFSTASSSCASSASSSSVLGLARCRSSEQVHLESEDYKRIRTPYNIATLMNDSVKRDCPPFAWPGTRSAVLGDISVHTLQSSIHNLRRLHHQPQEEAPCDDEQHHCDDDDHDDDDAEDVDQGVTRDVVSSSSSRRTTTMSSQKRQRPHTQQDKAVKNLLTSLPAVVAKLRKACPGPAALVGSKLLTAARALPAAAERISSTGLEEWLVGGKLVGEIEQEFVNPLRELIAQVADVTQQMQAEAARHERWRDETASTVRGQVLPLTSSIAETMERLKRESNQTLQTIQMRFQFSHQRHSELGSEAVLVQGMRDDLRDLTHRRAQIDREAATLKNQISRFADSYGADTKPFQRIRANHDAAKQALEAVRRQLDDTVDADAQAGADIDSVGAEIDALRSTIDETRTHLGSERRKLEYGTPESFREIGRGGRMTPRPDMASSLVVQEAFRALAHGSFAPKIVERLRGGDKVDSSAAPSLPSASSPAASAAGATTSSNDTTTTTTTATTTTTTTTTKRRNCFVVPAPFHSVDLRTADEVRHEKEQRKLHAPPQLSGAAQNRRRSSVTGEEAGDNAEADEEEDPARRNHNDVPLTADDDENNPFVTPLFVPSCEPTSNNILRQLAHSLSILQDVSSWQAKQLQQLRSATAPFLKITPGTSTSSSSSASSSAATAAAAVAIGGSGSGGVSSGRGSSSQQHHHAPSAVTSSPTTLSGKFANICAALGSSIGSTGGSLANSFFSVVGSKPSSSSTQQQHQQTSWSSSGAHHHPHPHHPHPTTTATAATAAAPVPSSNNDGSPSPVRDASSLRSSSPSSPDRMTGEGGNNNVSSSSPAATAAEQAVQQAAANNLFRPLLPTVELPPRVLGRYLDELCAAVDAFRKANPSMFATWTPVVPSSSNASPSIVPVIVKFLAWGNAAAAATAMAKRHARAVADVSNDNVITSTTSTAPSTTQRRSSIVTGSTTKQKTTNTAAQGGKEQQQQSSCSDASSIRMSTADQLLVLNTALTAGSSAGVVCDDNNNNNSNTLRSPLQVAPLSPLSPSSSPQKFRTITTSSPQQPQSPVAAAVSPGGSGFCDVDDDDYLLLVHHVPPPPVEEWPHWFVEAVVKAHTPDGPATLRQHPALYCKQAVLAGALPFSMVRHHTDIIRTLRRVCEDEGRDCEAVFVGATKQEDTVFRANAAKCLRRAFLNQHLPLQLLPSVVACLPRRLACSPADAVAAVHGPLFRVLHFVQARLVAILFKRLGDCVIEITPQKQQGSIHIPSASSLRRSGGGSAPAAALLHPGTHFVSIAKMRKRMEGAPPILTASLHAQGLLPSQRFSLLDSNHTTSGSESSSGGSNSEEMLLAQLVRTALQAAQAARPARRGWGVGGGVRGGGGGSVSPNSRSRRASTGTAAAVDETAAAVAAAAAALAASPPSGGGDGAGGNNSGDANNSGSNATSTAGGARIWLWRSEHLIDRMVGGMKPLTEQELLQIMQEKANQQTKKKSLSLLQQQQMQQQQTPGVGRGSSSSGARARAQTPRSRQQQAELHPQSGGEPTTTSPSPIPKLAASTAVVGSSEQQQQQEETTTTTTATSRPPSATPSSRKGGAAPTTPSRRTPTPVNSTTVQQQSNSYYNPHQKQAVAPPPAFKLLKMPAAMVGIDDWVDALLVFRRAAFDMLLCEFVQAPR